MCVWGGGVQQASCLVAKQAVEFPQVLASITADKLNLFTIYMKGNRY